MRRADRWRRLRAWALCSTGVLVLVAGCLPMEPSSPTPVIEQIVPPGAMPGRTVTLVGTDFGRRRGQSDLVFGRAPVQYLTSWTDTEIVAVVPHVETGNVEVRLTVEDVESRPFPFTVTDRPVPVISSIEPPQAFAGQTIAIVGKDFGDERRDTDTVVFAEDLDAGDAVATWTDTRIEVAVPAEAVTGEIVVVTGGGASAPFPLTVGDGPTLTQIKDEIFTPTCAVAECHDSTTARAGLVLEAAVAFASLVGVDSREQPGTMRVAPGNPDGSWLIVKVSQEDPPFGERMPRDRPPLPTADIELIRGWIAAGAPNN